MTSCQYTPWGRRGTLWLWRLQTRIAILREYGARSEDNHRAAQRTLFGFSNSFKSLAGKLIGLKDQRLMARKLTFEKKLRKAVENDSHLGVDAAKVWDDVAIAYKSWAPLEKPFELLERPAAQGEIRRHHDSPGAVAGRAGAQAAPEIRRLHRIP